MTSNTFPFQYRWASSDPHTNAYLLNPIQALLQDCSPCQSASARVLDLGCGNGALAEQLQLWGFTVIGIDPSASGIAEAKKRCPTAAFHQTIADTTEISRLELKPLIWL